MRRALALVAIVACALSAAGVAQADDGLRIEFVDTSGYPDVVLVVTVPPSMAGVDVSEGFSVNEDGRPRPMAARPLEGDPLEVMLLVDVSGSMSGEPLADATAAAAAFAEALPTEALVGVIGFGTSVVTPTPLTLDRAAVVDGLAGLTATGETALYDAVVAATAAFDTSYEARRVIVLVSDGGDTASAASIGDAREALEAGEFGLYALSLLTEETDLSLLESLASVGTGRVVSAADSEGLASVYEEVAADLASQYLVVYGSSAEGPTRLVVSVTYESVAASSATTVDLTRPSATVTETSVTTAAPATTVGAIAEEVPTGSGVAAPDPKTVIGAGPGLLGEPWAMAIGISAVGLALLLLFVPAVLPAGRRRIAAGTTTAVSSLGSFVSGVSGRAESVVSRILRRRGSGGTLDHWLASAGIHLRPGEFVLLVLSWTLAAMAITAIVAGPLAVIVVASTTLITPWLVIKVMVDRRRAAFADQLDGTLQMIAGSLRAGYGLLQSVNTVSSESPSPTSDEFQSIVMETRLGRDLMDALDSSARRVDSRDFEWIVQAIKIQREVGGDLADLLDTIAKTIRDRRQVQRQVQAMSAEGRMSAVILIALPFVIGLVITATTPGYLRVLWETTTGRVLMAAGAVLMGIGTIWTRRIVRLDF